MRLLPRRHTPEQVAAQLIDGLEGGRLYLNDDSYQDSSELRSSEAASFRRDVVHRIRVVLIINVVFLTTLCVGAVLGANYKDPSAQERLRVAFSSLFSVNLFMMTGLRLSERTWPHSLLIRILGSLGIWVLCYLLIPPTVVQPE